MLFASIYSGPTSTSAFLVVFFGVCTSAGGSLAQAVTSVVQTVLRSDPNKAVSAAPAALLPRPAPLDGSG